MTEPSLPAWSFEADWADDCLETMEWLTNILRSPTGAEQRRGLRLYPRQTFEFRVLVKRKVRSLFDNMLTVYGSKDWRVPLWHSVHFTETDNFPGQTFIACTTAQSEFASGDVAFLSTDAFNHESVRISSVSPHGLNLLEPFSRAWPAGTKFYPARVARLTEQPKLRRETSDLASAVIRFKMSERRIEPSLIPLETYRGFPVLSLAPDESERLDYGFDRILEEIDNQTGQIFRHDSANKAFPTQTYRWNLTGRESLQSFRSLMFGLRGRLVPLWVPTFFDDFFLSEIYNPGEAVLKVENTGYTATGGPRVNRQDVLIELHSGERFMRHLVASTMAPDGSEHLRLNTPLPVTITPENVARISFMALSRLDHDNVEISHRTDTAGVSIAKVTFRSAPDLRVPKVGF